jgi:hypothetical protein
MNESKMDEHCDDYDYEEYYRFVCNLKDLPDSEPYPITDSDELPF